MNPYLIKFILFEEINLTLIRPFGKRNSSFGKTNFFFPKELEENISLNEMWFSLTKLFNLHTKKSNNDESLFSKNANFLYQGQLPFLDHLLGQETISISDLKPILEQHNHSWYEGVYQEKNQTCFFEIRHLFKRENRSFILEHQDLILPLLKVNDQNIFQVNLSKEAFNLVLELLVRKSDSNFFSGSNLRLLTNLIRKEAGWLILTSSSATPGSTLQTLIQLLPLEVSSEDELQLIHSVIGAVALPLPKETLEELIVRYRIPLDKFAFVIIKDLNADLLPWWSADKPDYTDFRNLLSSQPEWFELWLLHYSPQKFHYELSGLTNLRRDLMMFYDPAKPPEWKNRLSLEGKRLLAAKLLSLIVLFSDDYLYFSSETSTSPIKSFFRIFSQLSLDLQEDAVSSCLGIGFGPWLNPLLKKYLSFYLRFNPA